ncbi:MAG TPA: hypothetical protein PLF13_01190 [candidate division Zixibacteria bacterium]|nr:hypothetical protein [candidate division Zixibacteria bacterium]
MRRNTKFLLLFAILVTSIMAVYFVSGCGDDTTNITVPDNTNDTTNNNNNDTIVNIEADDEVIGSVQGIVTSTYDNSVLSGVTVTWTKNDQSFTYATNAAGYYLIDDSLSSGYYELTFTLTGYTIINATVYIPTIEEIRGSTSDEAAGDEEYMETMNVQLYPMTATVTGTIYTAMPDMPAAAGKDAPIMAQDDFDPAVGLAAGVDVVLDYSTLLGYYYEDSYYYYSDARFQVNKYNATTDANGVFTFNNVPLVIDNWFYDSGAKKDGTPDMASGSPWTGVRLLIMPFTLNDSAYAYCVYNFIMNPGTTTLPNLFVPLAGSGDEPVATNKPAILTYNFEQPGFLVDENLVLTFSKSMDSVMFDFDLPFDFGYTWANTYRTLTINPALDLVPDQRYIIKLYGYGLNGLELYGGEFMDTLYTQQGMRFVTTNLDDYGATDGTDDFTQIPLATAITLTFDMNVDLSEGFIELRDIDGGNRLVNFASSGDGTQTVTITPTQILESDHRYSLDFEIYSTLRNDYVTDAEVATGALTFRTVYTGPAMVAPTNFVINYDEMGGDDWVADWDNTSFYFQWTSVPGADYYQIFAKDNINNTDVVLVEDSVQDYSYLQRQVGSVDLTSGSNTQFDLYFDDLVQTPFSGATEVTFYVRAVDPLGNAGPFSAGITIADEVEPVFMAHQVGNADNAGGEESSTFYIGIGPDLLKAMSLFEYLGAIECSFIEAGGDPNFVLTSAAVEWTFGNDMRSVYGVVTVPAGATASGDMMIINLYDNSNNMAVDTIYLYPWVTITSPVDTTSTFMAQEFLVTWNSTDPEGLYNIFDMYLSLDGGTTWFDTLLNVEDDGSETIDVDDTLFSTTAMIGLQDTTAGGGWIWTSDLFTWAGLKLTAPDSSTYDTITTIYDEGGIDSTGIPIAFSYAGLDSIQVFYMLSPGGLIRVVDTIVTDGSGTYSYTWYPEDRGENYTCYLGIRALSYSHPIHYFGWGIDVIHDYVDITGPMAADCITGGADTVITWTSDFNPASSQIVLQYSLDDTTTWTTLADTVANDGVFIWSVGSTIPSNDSAWVRILNQDDVVLDLEGPFSVSGIVLDSPLVGTEWRGGTSHNILWSTVCSPGTIDLYYSHDNFVTDSTLIVANTADDGTHTWSVPNTADANVWIRAFTNTHNTYTTAGPFTISGVTLTDPNGGEVLSSGGSYLITWNTIGTLMDSVGLHYSINGGSWTLIADDIPNTGSYTWTVANNPADSVSIRVGKNQTYNGNDVCDAPFKIAGIIVTSPNGGETWTLNHAETITWEEISITSAVKIEYTLNMTDYYIIPGASSIAAGTKTFNWDLNPSNDPNLAASNTCLIRITEASGLEPMSDASNTSFEIVAP